MTSWHGEKGNIKTDPLLNHNAGIITKKATERRQIGIKMSFITIRILYYSCECSKLKKTWNPLKFFLIDFCTWGKA